MHDSDPENGELGDISAEVLCLSYQVIQKLKSKKRKKTKVTPIFSDKQAVGKIRGGKEA